ncbi:aldo/keto reductase [Nonomuraea bangladeshensis]|uniref:Aldo/keto reductase n=1 Tax=Nonomuraea bangladeshensis TaxID=404385 RepID=A0ABV3GZS6_9ACTN
MRTHRLGHTTTEVTELGFGGGPLGGLFEPLDDDTAAQALTAARDAGIRYFAADVCEAHGVTVPQAAMAFPLRHPAVAGIVVGMRSAQEVRLNTAAFSAHVPAGLWSDLRDEGLLDERAPVDVAP